MAEAKDQQQDQQHDDQQADDPRRRVGVVRRRPVGGTACVVVHTVLFYFSVTCHTKTHAHRSSARNCRSEGTYQRDGDADDETRDGIGKAQPHRFPRSALIWAARSAALHGLQTMPATVGVIDSVVAGVLVALISILIGASTPIAVATGSVAFLIAVILISLLTRKSFDEFARTLPSRFPTTGGDMP